MSHTSITGPAHKDLQRPVSPPAATFRSGTIPDLASYDQIVVSISGGKDS